MALRAGYYGLKKKLLNKVKALPGIKSIGSGLSLNSATGELTAIGTTLPIEPNPEGAATEDLNKLLVGETIYGVNDNTKCYQIDDATESAIVDADYIPFLDSSAASGAGAPKKSTWTNFISKIKAKITEFVTWEANGVLGAKNFFDYTLEKLKTYNTSGTWNDNVYTIRGITFTINSDMSITMNGTQDGTDYGSDLYLCGANSGAGRVPVSLVNGKKLCAGIIIDNTIINYGWWYYDSSKNYMNAQQTIQTGDDEMIASIPSGAAYITPYLRVVKDKSVSNFTIYPMLILAEDVDKTFTPYAMTNKELTDRVYPRREISSADDLNNIVDTGFYWASSAPTNTPESQIYFSMEVLNSGALGVVRQIIYASSGSSSAIYTRTYSGSTWKNWVKFTGTEVTP